MWWDSTSASAVVCSYSTISPFKLLLKSNVYSCRLYRYAITQPVWLECTWLYGLWEWHQKKHWKTGCDSTHKSCYLEKWGFHFILPPNCSSDLSFQKQPGSFRLLKKFPGAPLEQVRSKKSWTAVCLFSFCLQIACPSCNTEKGVPAPIFTEGLCAILWHTVQAQHITFVLLPSLYFIALCKSTK